MDGIRVQEYYINVFSCSVPGKLKFFYVYFFIFQVRVITADTLVMLHFDNNS